MAQRACRRGTIVDLIGGRARNLSNQEQRLRSRLASLDQSASALGSLEACDAFPRRNAPRDPSSHGRSHVPNGDVQRSRQLKKAQTPMAPSGLGSIFRILRISRRRFSPESRDMHPVMAAKKGRYAGVVSRRGEHFSDISYEPIEIERVFRRRAELGPRRFIRWSPRLDGKREERGGDDGHCAWRAILPKT